MDIGRLYQIHMSDVFPSTCINCNNEDKVYYKDQFNNFMGDKCIRINYELEPLHPLDYSYDVDIYDIQI